MSRTLVLDLPDAVDGSVVQDLRAEIEVFNGVEESGADTMRGIDAATLMMWVTFSGEAIAAISTVVTTVQMITDRIRKKKVQGVVIELPNGARIIVDSATPAEIRQIVEDWNKE